MAKVHQFVVSLALIMMMFGYEVSTEDREIRVISMGLEQNDQLDIFMDSFRKYDYNLQMYSLDKSGRKRSRISDGRKLMWLKKALQPLKNQKNLIVMVVKSHDATIITAGAERLLTVFDAFGARVVFAADLVCWPNKNLDGQYPAANETEKRFLNAGAFMGYASDIYRIISQDKINAKTNVQLYFSDIFVNKALREKFSIKLDTRSKIFQYIDETVDDLEVKFTKDRSYLYNHLSGTLPIVIRGYNMFKDTFYSMTSYLNNNWSFDKGCIRCLENKFSLQEFQNDDFPQVLVAIFLEYPVHFLEDCLDKISQLHYPKRKMDVFIHYSDEFHADQVQKFMNDNSLMSEEPYNSIRVISPSHGFREPMARLQALRECARRNCQYFFSVDGDVQLENPDTLQFLIGQNRTAIAPALSYPSASALFAHNAFQDYASSNFYPKVLTDYQDIIDNNLRGMWIFPNVRSCYLIQGHMIPSIIKSYAFQGRNTGMGATDLLRKQGVFLRVHNEKYFGHLTTSKILTKRKHVDLYAMASNPYTWEKKYIHEDYMKTLIYPNDITEQPCRDVFWGPLFSPTFCRHLIEEVEYHGEWSGSKHEDKRLSGGYENVPTDDIHMTQINFEDDWLAILKRYVAPVNSELFRGYHTQSQAHMNFVVRYTTTGQDRLRPHSDSSTYTINVALNNAGVDFQGGGVRFLRYNCSVTQTRVGWMLMNPGRLTHEHEGLPITGGTRYIMVSFIDPP